MAQSQFYLSWDAHKSNICSGLSALQQNGEFVDMTLAADGHHVKVHQVIMALASQYIKDLISTAQCPHPVVFLNKVSYNTLSAILEYIYTGEVQVPIAKLAEFIDAGKELHIKGLEDMVFNHASSNIVQNTTLERNNETANDDSEMLEEYCLYSEYDNEHYVINASESQNSAENTEIVGKDTNENIDRSTFEEMEMEEQEDAEVITDTKEPVRTPKVIRNRSQPVKIDSAKKVSTKNDEESDGGVSVLQYTVSTQGSLQMILNRFLYFLKYITRDGHRHWRCVDYLNATRCPALVITKDDAVVQRASAHIHSFHDKKILKKVRTGSIYTAIQEAELEGSIKKEEKEKNASKTPDTE